MGAASFPYRPGDIIAMFCKSPSFNFDGGPETRRRLRKIRDAGGVGKFLYVSFRLEEHYGRRDIKVTTRPRAVPKGYAYRKAWHSGARDIQTIANTLAFRCPRCFSGERPVAFRDKLFVRDVVWSGDPILCDRCRQMKTIRTENEITALREMTRDLFKKVKHHGRHV